MVWCSDKGSGKQQVQDTPSQETEEALKQCLFSEIMVAEPKPTEENRLQLRREWVESLMETQSKLR